MTLRPKLVAMDKLLAPRTLKLVGLALGVVATVIAFATATPSATASHGDNPATPITIAIVAFAFVHASSRPTS